MAPRGSPEDPKATALRESRCLNPHRRGVRFRGLFRRPRRRAGQYEMVRCVRVEGAPVTATAAANIRRRRHRARCPVTVIHGHLAACPRPGTGAKLGTEPDIAWRPHLCQTVKTLHCP